MRISVSLVAVLAAGALFPLPAKAAVDAPGRAIVLVTGGQGDHPFITPTTCRNSTDFDVIREGLAHYGIGAYVAPSHAGANTTAPIPDKVDCIEVNKSVQINSAASVDDQGTSLADFLVFLRDNYNRTTFDLVGYSMGGLVSRKAIAVVKQRNLTGIKVASLTTMASPHQGSYAYNWVAGLLTDDEVKKLVGEQGFKLIEDLKLFPDEGAGGSLTTTWLNGPNGWNSRQVGVLDDVDVALMGADALGGGTYLVNDGSVPLSSQLILTPDGTVPSGAVRKVWNDVHSKFITKQLGMPDDKSIHEDRNGSVPWLSERLAKLWGKDIVVTTITTKPSSAGKLESSLFWVLASLLWLLMAALLL